MDKLPCWFKQNFIQIHISHVMYIQNIICIKKIRSKAHGLYRPFPAMFSLHFSQGVNFCDFLFASLAWMMKSFYSSPLNAIYEKKIWFPQVECLAVWMPSSIVYETCSMEQMYKCTNFLQLWNRVFFLTKTRYVSIGYRCPHVVPGVEWHIQQGTGLCLITKGP